jgi:TPR repeat protein
VAAISWYRKAAVQGDAEGQFRLGLGYDIGKGVQQDYTTAMSWFRKAAAQGHTEAQGRLGRMYGLGDGVPQDYVNAHMWFNLAAVGGDKEAAKTRDMLAAHMTPAQIAEAQKLARDWKPTSTPAPH